MISSVLSIDLRRNDDDDDVSRLAFTKQSHREFEKTTTHISFCSAANTISIIIGSGTIIIEVDDVGDGDSGIG